MTFCLANYVHDLFRAGPPVDFATHFKYVPEVDPPADHVAGISAFAFLARRDIPFVVTSHAAYRKGRFPGRVVLVLRDPRDVVVSRYHMMTKHSLTVGCGFIDFLHGTRELGEIGVPSPVHALSRYLDSWVAPVLEGHALITSYEHWRASPEQGLTGLLTALELPIDRDLVATACARSDVCSMRRAEARQTHHTRADFHAHRGPHPEPPDPDSQFVRRAVVGGWRLDLDGAERAALCRLLDTQITRRTKDMFRRLGLPYEFGES
jgi:hypothetical protein